jgi:hypothetical protein
MWTRFPSRKTFNLPETSARVRVSPRASAVHAGSAAGDPGGEHTTPDGIRTDPPE